MKNVVFIASHMGSGSHILSKLLNLNPRIMSIKTNKVYQHPFALDNLTATPHKLRNAAAIYLDELLFNHSLCCDYIFEICQFIYLVREPRETLNNILQDVGYHPYSAYHYYRHRLRRLYEMARKTPGAVFLTWEDVVSGSGLRLIENYLNLKEPIQPVTADSSKNLVHPFIVKAAEITYEKYLYKCRKLKLLVP